MTLAATQTRQPLTPERGELPANSEHRLTLVTPEFQDQLAIAWGELDHWVSFRVRAQLVRQIYQGESLDVNLVEMRDTVVVPEYMRQERIALDEAADVHTRLLPGLKLRAMIAEDDISQAHSHNDSIRVERRTDDLGILTKDIDMMHMKARIKETTAASIHSLLISENQDSLNRQVDTVTRKAKKEALHEVIHVLVDQTKTIRNGLQPLDFDREAAETIKANEHKVTTLRAELHALEAVEDYNRDEKARTLEAQHATPKESWQEKMHPRAIVASLAGLALAFQVSLFK